MTRYEDDLYAWSTEQAALLKAGHMALLDLPHVIEELGNVGMSEYSELSNHLGILLSHLLKLHLGQEHKPHDFARAGRGWWLTCREQRVQIAKKLRRNPTLRKDLATMCTDEYEAARLNCAQYLPIAEDLIPLTCPWSVEDVLTVNWFPELAQ
jgi:uncharacterized protein DUF29